MATHGQLDCQSRAARVSPSTSAIEQRRRDVSPRKAHDGAEALDPRRSTWNQERVRASDGIRDAGRGAGRASPPRRDLDRHAEQDGGEQGDRDETQVLHEIESRVRRLGLWRPVRARGLISRNRQPGARPFLEDDAGIGDHERPSISGGEPPERRPAARCARSKRYRKTARRGKKHDRPEHDESQPRSIQRRVRRHGVDLWKTPADRESQRCRQRGARSQAVGPPEVGG